MGNTKELMYSAAVQKCNPPQKKEKKKNKNKSKTKLFILAWGMMARVMVKEKIT